jgi:N-acetylglucosaminyldiphosphoundecaprenol N-acetyl-beta-D-mannosaminyltransferase
MNLLLNNFLIRNCHKVLIKENPDLLVEKLKLLNTGIVANINMLSLSLIVKDDEFRKLLEESTVIMIDGIGASLALYFATRKWVKPHGYKVWAESYLIQKRGLRILMIGGTQEESEAAAEKFSHQGVNASFLNGYFDQTSYVKTVTELRPEICFVGMGMPLQEKVIYSLNEYHPCCLYFPCGGFIKQIAGFEKNCPPALARLHLEWLWRCINKRGHFKERVWAPLFDVFR